MQNPATFGLQKQAKRLVEPQIHLILRVGDLFPPHAALEAQWKNEQITNYSRSGVTASVVGLHLGPNHSDKHLIEFVHPQLRFDLIETNLVSRWGWIGLYALLKLVHHADLTPREQVDVVSQA
jgi:hypothetical protein